MCPKRRNLQPLTPAALEEMALAYVARFATTQSKLRAYLRRKLRERGWAEESSPPVEALVGRYADLGYVDDAAWARMKAGSLLRRGYGARRVGEALQVAGVDADLRDAVRPAELEQRRAALVLARRRRFGPFAVQAPDRPAREKQVAAMMRAGHRLDIARRIVDAENPEAAEEWAESASGEDSCA
ncbi:MAG TPA: RecX family transcriptional regulator [Novosphingobium sp.]|nr:RecX family transcriptional regulator [Novosphingobium sp.]